MRQHTLEDRPAISTAFGRGILEFKVLSDPGTCLAAPVHIGFELADDVAAPRT